MGATMLAAALVWGQPSSAEAARFPFTSGKSPPATQTMQARAACCVPSEHAVRETRCCTQVPEERMPELSLEEREHVELFMKATPSVVNITNIGALLGSTPAGNAQAGAYLTHVQRPGRTST